MEVHSQQQLVELLKKAMQATKTHAEAHPVLQDHVLPDYAPVVPAVDPHLNK